MGDRPLEALMRRPPDPARERSVIRRSPVTARGVCAEYGQPAHRSAGLAGSQLGQVVGVGGPAGEAVLALGVVGEEELRGIQPEPVGASPVPGQGG
ncbi:hypothetical protein L0F81_22220 [Streptomyces tricolor]|uniref:Uncharacterized protein n=1 Tax=Streptomyces tricolor TaxID=68277 RepID=A0ABS9JKA4_9ACTN|nr:hypothetical protein [Streptomyces tricolor]MCG0065978.1 hypothetical protein [Streptomyces tricolor]